MNNEVVCSEVCYTSHISTVVAIYHTGSTYNDSSQLMLVCPQNCCYFHSYISPFVREIMISTTFNLLYVELLLFNCLNYK